jgi:hypothetical protein
MRSRAHPLRRGLEDEAFIIHRRPGWERTSWRDRRPFDTSGRTDRREIDARKLRDRRTPTISPLPRSTGESCRQADGGERSESRPPTRRIVALEPNRFPHRPRVHSRQSPTRYPHVRRPRRPAGVDPGASDPSKSPTPTSSEGRTLVRPSARAGSDPSAATATAHPPGARARTARAATT